MPNWSIVRAEAVATVRYFYYLRFSVLFFLLVPVLAREDATSGISAFTRGIFTPATFWQYFGTVFFLVCLGMMALVTSRLVCLNGMDRFGVLPPWWLRKTLGTDSEGAVGWTLFAFQVPGVYVLWRIFANGYLELVFHHWDWDSARVILGALSGIVLAFAFWWVVTVVYYWTYDYAATQTKARTLILPRWSFGLEPFADPPVALTIETERINSPAVFNPIRRIFSLLAQGGPGYGNAEGELYEGHRMAATAFLSYLAVYIFLFPLIAPTPQVFGYRIALAGLLILSGLASAGIWKIASNRWPKWLLLAIAATLFGFSAYFLKRTPFSFQGFPVAASVLVLVTLLILILPSVSFFLDRYYVSVTISLVVYFYLSHLVTGFGGEHYFHTVAPPLASTAVSQPADVLQRFRQAHCKDQKEVCKMIVVTATGGGIHSAAWTAALMTEMEKRIQEDAELSAAHFQFHDRLLYLSTVSGGSVGMAPFLREYYADKPFLPIGDVKDYNKEPFWTGSIRRAANCSSLGAIGWGLVYSDFLHLVFPIRQVSRDSDRSQSLERALARNLDSDECDPNYNADKWHTALRDKELTLGRMTPYALDGAGNMPADLPAFAFNTTDAETGGRFLLSNYSNGPETPVQLYFGVLPAETLRTTYPAADIDLLTAARLSATYPFVSSAARIEKTSTYPAGDHFVDGGYFDNDGTASAVEFLEEAFQGAHDGPPVEILYIQLRDSADLNTDIRPEAYSAQVTRHASKDCPQSVVPWNASNQLEAPLKAAYNASLGAITRRNRRELELLVEYLGKTGQAKVKPVVFAYTGDHPQPGKGEASQPLSWHLTPLQIARIGVFLQDSVTQTQLDSVVVWSKSTQGTPALAPPR